MSNINLCKRKYLKLTRYPYVYNSRDNITTTKNYYKAKDTEPEYKEILAPSRKGINMILAY